MLSRLAAFATLLISSSGPLLGQNADTLPSKDEILELLTKADEKVAVFQDTVKGIQPDLDKVKPKLAENYLDAARTARELISATKAKGPSAYRLLGILATLDDLSLDAATAAVMLLLAMDRPRDPGVMNKVVVLMSSKNGCNDIAELIMHATMRLVHVEETLLDKAK